MKSLERHPKVPTANRFDSEDAMLCGDQLVKNGQYSSSSSSSSSSSGSRKRKKKKKKKEKKNRNL